MISEEEAYRGLLAGVLWQAIQDYVGSKRLIVHNRREAARWNISNRIKSVEQFFADPPYDYGDIDFTHLKKLCDEKAREGTRLYHKG